MLEYSIAHFPGRNTDKEVKHSAGLLTAERTAHLHTKAALTTREELIAIVSHDLRNPVGGIASATEMLESDPSYSNLTAEAQELVQFVKRNAEGALRLISDILEMERFSEGKLLMQFAQYRVEDMIKESIDTLAHVARQNQIALTMSPANKPITVTCDKDRILQVLSNLIGNAVKFTPPGGSVVVSVEDDGAAVKISVCDNGTGIPKDHQGFIFKRFGQLQKQDRRGLGLGLNISQTLVEAHDGKLLVTSVEGEGSNFSFTLPKNLGGHIS